MNTVKLDETGYPVGQKWAVLETSDGYVATLVSNTPGLATVVLEAIALNNVIPSRQMLVTWSSFYHFEVTFMKLK